MKSWVDTFLIWDAIIVLCLTFVDWLIGTDGRRHLRDTMADWWVYVKEASFRALLANDAARLSLGLDRLLGTRIFASRYLIRVTAANLVLAVLGALVVAPHMLSDFFDARFSHVVPQAIEIANAAPSGFTASLILIIVVGAANVATMHRLLVSMGRALSVAKLILFVFLNGVIGTLVFLVVTKTSTWLTTGNSDNSAFSVFFDWFVALFTILFWSTVFIIIAFIFALSKLSRPIFKAPLSLFLERLAESDKGVLSLIAVGIGALAKIVQELFKSGA